MKRIVALASLVAALSVACTDERVPSAPAVSQPMFEIKDGHVGGNPKFFFLFPIRRLADDAKVPSTGFNPDLAPVIEVYECAGTSATGCVLPLGARKSRLTMGGTALLNRIFVLPQFKEYAALWDTRSLGLLTDRTYRIQVLVGGEVLGFADVDVVRTLREAASVNPNDFVPLLQNLILPIRFWIGVTGNSKPIDLALGGTVVLATTGDRVTIPPQGPGKPVITVTVQPCTDAAGTPKSIDVDLPTFGNCLRVTTDPEIATDLSPKATVSICSLLPVVPILPGSQKELLTLHRQKGAVIQALPHAPNDFCPPPPLPLGSAAPSGVRGWAAAGWRWTQRSVAALIGPRRLYAGSASREASTALLDVGEAGGLTPLLSDFQFALPAKMDYVVPSDASRTAPVGNLFTQVMVTDARNGAVAGAKVTFRVPAGESPGTILATALSNAAGIAQVQWPIVVGTNTLIASGRGIATPSANGPAEGFDPFTPPVDPAMTPAEREFQVPVTLLAGTVTFTATGTPALVLYGVESSTDGLSTINTTNGAVTFIGRLDPDITIFTTPVALGVRPSDQTLFVWNNSNLGGTTGVLLTVNRCTGRGTRVNATTQSQGTLSALAFAPNGNLYGLGDNELYQIDIPGGAKAFVGRSSVAGFSAAGADFRADGTLFAIELNALGTERLVTVNPATGEGTVVATLNTGGSPVNVGIMGSIAFDPSGTLIGTAFGSPLSTPNPGGDILFDINASTGAISNIRNGGGGAQGLGFAPACSL